MTAYDTVVPTQLVKSSEEYRAVDVPMNKIFVDYKFNSRGEVRPSDILDLKDSLEKGPLQTPVTVQPYINGSFEWKLVSGFRRHMAFKCLGRTTIPCFIRLDLTEDTAHEHNIIENLIRRDLDKVQEAKALKYFFDKGWPLELIGEKFGQSIKWVRLRQVILKFPQTVQDMVALDILSPKQILAFENMTFEQQCNIIRSVKDQTFKTEHLGVRMRNTPKVTKINRKYLLVEKPTDKQLEDLKMVMWHGIGPDLHTQMISWVQGHTSVEKIWNEVVKYCIANGFTIDIPEDIRPLITSKIDW